MQPYLTIVATSRNDDHGGNLVGRMQAFANNIGEYALRHNAAIELIVVEWNPPADKPRLAEAVNWPSNACVVTRIIDVPNEVHNQYSSSDRLPLFQMIGKNVGIRRAAADYILATNVDILFPEPFYKLIAEKNLEPGHMYRTDRLDVNRDIPYDVSADEQIRYAAKNLVSVHYQGFSAAKGNGALSWFGSYAATFGAHAALITKRLLTIARLLIRAKRNKKHLDYHVPYLQYEFGMPSRIPKLHTNACGDFQMMHKDDWNRIQGYYEFEGYSMHLDSYASYAAHQIGISEKVLPFACYHIDHKGGWTVQTEKDGSFDKGLKKRGLGYVSLEIVYSKLIGEDKEPFYENKSDWGLEGIELEEVTI